MFDKFAEELKAAREKNGLTIQQVAAKSRIDIKFLEAMEIGDFSFLPELYVKAFVKDYAKIVGLDPVIMLKKYNAARQGEIYSEEAEENKNISEPPVENNEPEPKPAVEQPPIEKSPPIPATTSFDSTSEVEQLTTKSNSSSKNKVMAILLGVSILILAALAYLIFFNKSAEIIVNDKPAKEEVQNDNPNKQRYVEVKPRPLETIKTDSIISNTKNTILSADSLLLNIKASDTSWVRIVIDDTLEEEFILFPQSQKNIRAGVNYKIAFGRAKAIELQINKKPLKFSPRTEVSYVLIDKNGLQYLTRSEYMGSN